MWCRGRGWRLLVSCSVGLEVAGRVAGWGYDGADLVGQSVGCEVGVDGAGGVAADDGGVAAGVAASGQGLVDVGGGDGLGDGGFLDAG